MLCAPSVEGLRTKTLSVYFWASPMAIILIAVVLAVITGLNYFGKPISRTMWLVLFILSSVALVLILLTYFHF
jgi:antibiotic biosynthesis monooxygenase (ABM) superfamily enzyme